MTRAGEQDLERREFKYLVPNHVLPRLRSAVAATCAPDRHAGPDGTYRIRSLYLDTPSYDLFYANNREAAERFKARIRCYPDSTSPVFLEIKTRLLDTIVKTRAPVPRDGWQAIVEGKTAASGEASPSHAERGRERFLALVHSYHLRPVVLVEYRREAYVSAVDVYARATFDTRIACQPRHALELEADPRRWRPVPHPGRTVTEPAYTVVELKFGPRAPEWMVALVRRFDLMRHSFSKYGYALRAEWALPTSRVPTAG